MSYDYTASIVVTGADGEDYDIEIGIDYDANYEPARVSGPPEDCYPDGSELTVNRIDIISKPACVTDAAINDVIEAKADDINDWLWDDYFSRKEAA